MHKHLFRIVEGRVEPAVPRDAGPDGVTLLSLEQAVDFCGIDAETLRKRWDHFYGDFVPAVVGVPSVAAGTPSVPTSTLHFTVGAAGKVYRTYVTAERLVNGKGEPAAGRCDWGERLILINGNYPRETWKETWLHECRHAWDFHFKRPDDHEHAIDWDSNVGDEAQHQLDAQGGTAALLAMRPTTGVAPRQMIQANDKPLPPEQLLRRRFGHLNDVQFQQAEQMWTARRLNPWSDAFYVRVEHRRLRFVMTLAGMRARAVDSGDYRGGRVEQFVYDAQDHRRPSACLYLVYRMIGGDRVEFYAEAKWTDAYGDDPLKVSPLVLAKPHDCLEGLAEAKALRKAFPHECADIYTDDELRRPISFGAVARAVPTERALSTITLTSPNDRPGSADGMRGRLRELGVTTADAQRKLIREVETASGPCQDGEEPEFYARVVAAARHLVASSRVPIEAHVI